MSSRITSHSSQVHEPLSPCVSFSLKPFPPYLGPDRQLCPLSTIALHQYPPIEPPPDSAIPIQIAATHARLMYPLSRVAQRPFSAKISTIKLALDVLAHQCAFCWLLRKPIHSADHLLADCILCPNIYTTHRRPWLSWLSAIKFPEGYCWGCGCPQHVSDRLYKPVDVSHFMTALLHRPRQSIISTTPRQRCPPIPMQI